MTSQSMPGVKTNLIGIAIMLIGSRLVSVVFPSAKIAKIIPHGLYKETISHANERKSFTGGEWPGW